MSSADNKEKKLILRKATIEEVEKIYRLINGFASKDEMLPRSLSELYENIRDFYVFMEDTQLIGCAALHIFWKDLAEIKSLAVLGSHQRRGIGKKLVSACMQEAKELRIARCSFLRIRRNFLRNADFAG